jgi:ABC-type antimicrobial peptide transport system permease subunit
LGAKRRDITRQFLAETIVLSIVGGATGVWGGLICGPVVDAVRDGIAQAFPEVIQDLPDVIRTVSPVVVPWSIPLAFFISMAVGVVFGIYPAMRAAAMDPIEALRHE